MRNLFLSISMIAILVSCSDNEGTVLNGEKKDLRINASIGAVTRSGEKSEWETGDKLGVFVCNESLGNPYQNEGNSSNIPFSFGGNKWNSEKIPLDEKPATVFAYYPYAEANVNGRAVMIETASQTDYLYGIGSSKASALTNTNVNINMQHALSQVVFKMKKYDYTGGEGILSGVVISNCSEGKVLKISGTMDIESGSISASTAGNVSLSSNHTITDTETSYSAIVMPVPATTGNDLKVTFTIDGKELYYVFPAGTTWQAGYRNIYSFTLKDNDLIIGGDDGAGVTIEPWDDDDHGDISLIPVI